MELNKNGTLYRLSKNTGDTAFSLFGVDYYPNAASLHLPSLINSSYDYLILDLGTSTEDFIMDEFLRCDRKILLGSLSPWRQICYGNFLTNFLKTYQNHGTIVYLALFGIKDDLIEFSHAYHIYMQGVPFLANPFQLRKENLSFLEHMI